MLLLALLRGTVFIFLRLFSPLSPSPSGAKIQPHSFFWHLYRQLGQPARGALRRRLQALPQERELGLEVAPGRRAPRELHRREQQLRGFHPTSRRRLLRIGKQEHPEVSRCRDLRLLRLLLVQASPRRLLLLRRRLSRSAE